MLGVRAASVVFGVVTAFSFSGADAADRRYTLADGTALVLPLPAGWRDQERRPDALAPVTIAISPESGAPFQVLITVAVALQSKNPAAALEETRQTVAATAEKLKSQAVEKQIDLRELKGTALRGWYFRLTDRAPKNGEFKYLTQGLLAAGDARAAFTVLTNDGQRAQEDAALAMLKAARYVPLPSRRAAPGPRPPPADRAKLRALFDSGNFAQLDAELSAWQAAYRDGVIDDDAAAEPFIRLRRSDPDLRPAYDKWVAQMPDSYVARIARAHYLAELGWLARGAAKARDTSAAQFGDMRKYFADALEDTRTSLRLDPKPALGYGTAILIAQGAGAPDSASRLLIDAIGLDPLAYLPRGAYYSSLQPQWGGSLEQMELALAVWRNALDEPQRARLSRSLDDARWRDRLRPAAALVEAKQYAAAADLYTKALAERPTARAYAMRGYSYQQLGDHQKAVADYDRALEIDPDGECCSGTRSNRARSLVKLGQIDKAVADYKIAAENDDAFATRELAVMYAFGQHGFKRDYVQAKEWCERSAKQGDGLSMYCLGSLYHGGLGVAKDEKAAAKWFEGAAKRGVGDAAADLGIMYWNGIGIPKDRDQAIHWWREGVKRDNARAKQELERQLSSWEYFMEVTVAGWREKIAAFPPT